MDEASARARMDEVQRVLSEDLASIRTGRATPALVENVVVSAYGGAQRLKVLELATITATDPQTLVIEPWDKSVIGEIRQGVLAANIGLTPSIDGDKIRISTPPMTSEDRDKFVKILHVKLEHARVMVRQVRGDEMRDIKDKFEKKEMTEDEKFGSEKKLQELTDEYVGKIDERGKAKELELRQI
ncbi:ribosome recycling factor [Candidatus Woesebacteria bacterium RIFCSPHIGHO2_01_FULL_44_21]|uniref:Ribosome recycling factor n=1 Tax=Candidatus Woesebacteria bacterium RIFCSPHIGHO2_01_FULL_44_21 TaxID=1802503 RepID=A0A1F7YW80_9BACT|nr:MAG: ribosome recycling factor [Candidatus Woesebacteria bacterium RIFCSPHIGHO2_01_FULL_44_21]OGM68915.1 MAG: ribosome recycling factor [Candidatus Woesebacteria bacterium RIFCSPLOWO2_01_FULL_44_24b]